MSEVRLKSTIDVEYVDHMGDDRRVVEAMLVSTKGLNAEEAAQGAVEGRINFLMRRRHGTPFECGALTIRVHAPIKVFREWHRHRIGWSYNEESARYKQLEPVFWAPPIGRPMVKVDGFKPSAPEFRPATPEEYDVVCGSLAEGYQKAYELYDFMLGSGADPGLARDTLGVGIFSSMYATCNPRSVMAFLELRTREPAAKRPSSPLWEIDNAARQLEAIFKGLWPATYLAWAAHGRMAP